MKYNSTNNKNEHKMMLKTRTTNTQNHSYGVWSGAANLWYRLAVVNPFFDGWVMVERLDRRLKQWGVFMIPGSPV